MPPADNTPDFDSMSPEELMAWMESLAKRQGAVEGFTTAADMAVPEVDPSSVQVDEPGYVPFGMDPEKWKAKLAEEEAAKASRMAAPPPPQPSVAQPPAAREPAAPGLELPSLQAEEELAPTEPAPAIKEEAMSWLESLAADQGAVPEMDLSALQLEPLTALPESPAAGDPMAWLESLARSDEEETALPTADISEQPVSPPVEPTPAAAGVVDPLESGVDPMQWLESLAKRQGASEEELVTPADLSIPIPEGAAEGGPGYKDYTFETAEVTEAGELPELEGVSDTVSDFGEPSFDDPEAWLDSLAAAQGIESQAEAAPQTTTGRLSDDQLLAALHKGEAIAPEEMQAWMERQFERAEQVGDALEAEVDEEAPPVRAELPDWLLEQMGTPPILEEAAPAGAIPTPPARPEEQPALFDEITEPAAAEIPDWLKAAEPEELGIENIFAEPEAMTPAASPVAAGGDLEIDTGDPWVVAFEQERAEGMADVETVPDWYAERLKKADEAQEAPASTVSPLEPAALQPETELAAGEPDAVPDWLSDLTPVQEPAAAVSEELPDWLQEHAPAEAPAAAGELPDWLQEAAVEPEQVPDWLIQTLATEEQEAVAPPTPAPAAPQPTPPPARPAVSPVPVPAAAAIDVAAALSSARSKTGAGDIEGSLQDYEAVIRANAQLDAVVADLARLMEDKKHKDNPAIYRVLGDGLMRQGKLQTALDTYRKALNLL